MTILVENPNTTNTNNKFKQPSDTNEAVFQILNKSKFENIKDYLNSLNEWITYNFETIEKFFIKYPNISEDKFKKLFFSWNYNRNILMQKYEVLDLFDFDNIIPWADLIEIFIKKIWLNENEFKTKIDDLNIDIITFPWLFSQDIAQKPFYNKLSRILNNIQVVFWDENAFKYGNSYWKNPITADSVWFWWYMDKIPNMCAFKLIQTKAEQDKLNEVNKIFGSFEENVFIWWSSEWIPFSTKNIWVKNIALSRYSEKKWDLKLNKNSLENSLWYLNSAYYADKVIWAFVAKDHNIMESIHAGKPTISNHLENRYNHNWLASYIWEKVWLLHFVDSKQNFQENQRNIENFLSIPKEEIKSRKEKLDTLINSEIKEFVNWYLHSILKNIAKKED